MLAEKVSVLRSALTLPAAEMPMASISVCPAATASRYTSAMCWLMASASIGVGTRQRWMMLSFSSQTAAAILVPPISMASVVMAYSLKACVAYETAKIVTSCHDLP